MTRSPVSRGSASSKFPPAAIFNVPSPNAPVSRMGAGNPPTGMFSGLMIPSNLVVPERTLIASPDWMSILP